MYGSQFHFEQAMNARRMSESNLSECYGNEGREEFFEKPSLKNEAREIKKTLLTVTALIFLLVLISPKVFANEGSVKDARAMFIISKCNPL